MSHEQTPTGQFAAAIQLQWPQEKEVADPAKFEAE
jgi:hypothetical protein